MTKRPLVWLASYPKSGNTWVRLIFGRLLGIQEAEDDDGFAATGGITGNRLVFETLTGLDTFELSDGEIDALRPAVYRKMAEQADGIRFIKAHDAFRRLPSGESIFPADCSIGAIYLMRHPFDVVVSYSHHLGNQPFDQTIATLNKRDAYIAGHNREQLKQIMFDWSGHLRSWIEQKEMPVCPIRYEDLRRDPIAEIEKMVTFLGLSPNDLATSIADAVEAARFENLQRIEETRGFSERPIKSARFFRSGRSGEGKEKLTDSQQNSLIQSHRDAMREFGYL